MQIANCRIRGLDGRYDVFYEDGKFTDIVPTGVKPSEEEVWQADGHMLMPPFVEPHIHLDCVLTAGKPHYTCPERFLREYLHGRSIRRRSR